MYPTLFASTLCLYCSIPRPLLSKSLTPNLYWISSQHRSQWPLLPDFANSNKSLSSFNQQTDSYEEQPRFSILDHQDLSFDQVLDVLTSLQGQFGQYKLTKRQQDQLSMSCQVISRIEGDDQGDDQGGDQGDDQGDHKDVQSRKPEQANQDL